MQNKETSRIDTEKKKKWVQYCLYFTASTNRTGFMSLQLNK